MKSIPPVKELREICRKKVKPKGIVVPTSDYISIYLAKIFLYLPLNPNQITVLWTVIKTVAALFLISGNYLTMLIAVLIFQFASLLDAVDGIVARFRKQFSLNGIYLDLIGHYVSNSVLLMSLGIGLYRRTGESYYLAFGALGVFLILLSKALTVNPAWYKNETEQTRIYEIIYSYHPTLANSKSKVLIYLFDFLRIENPFNFMFWGFLFGYHGTILILYIFFLLFETVRKITLQYKKIMLAEQLEKNNP